MSKIVSSLSKVGVITVASLALGLTLNKIISSLYGPAGLATFSLVKQTVLAVSFFAVGAQAVVVQGLASRELSVRWSYFGQVFLIHFIIAFLSVLFFMAAIIFVLPPFVSASNPLFQLPVALTCLSAIFASVYFFSKSSLNGLGSVRDLLIVEVAGPGVMIFVMLLGFTLERFEMKPLLSFALLFSYFSMSLLGISFCFRQRRKVEGLSKFSFGTIREFQGFVSTSAFSVGAALTGTVCLLVLKTGIATHLGFESAGFFDAAWTVSTTYLAILVGTFNLYYLPALSSTSDHEIKNEIVRKIFKFTTISVSFLICICASSKTAIFSFLFTTEFSPATAVFRWMLIGDFFKMSAWVLALVSMSRGNFKTLFLTEFFFWIALSFFSGCFLKYSFGLEVAGILYCALYIVLFLFYFFETKINNFVDLTTNDLNSWCLSLAFVVISSSISWGEANVHWPSLVISVFGLPLLHYLILSREEKAVAKGVLSKFLML